MNEPGPRVRDAMIAEPRSLPATATAREAGEVLTPQEVRAVYVVDAAGGRVGGATRTTRGARVGAEGRAPGASGQRDADGADPDADAARASSS